MDPIIPYPNQASALKLELADGSSALVPALTEGRSILSSERARHIRDHHANLQGNLSSATRDAMQIEKAISKMKDSDEGQLSVLHQNLQTVKAAHAESSLDLMRRLAGLGESKQRLEERIYEKASFEEGFKMFQHAVYIKSGVKVETIEELNQIFPNLTSHEILLVSLLKRVPKTMLTQTYESVHSYGNDREVVKTRQALPMVYDLNFDGVYFTLQVPDERRLQTNDVEYTTTASRYLGLTENLEGIEHVPFKHEFKRAFRALALLIVQDNQIFEKLWISENSIPLIGHGKLQIAMLKQLETFAEDDIDAQAIRVKVSELNINLGDPDLSIVRLRNEYSFSEKLFTDLDNLIAKRLANKRIIECTKNIELSANIIGLFRLAGMLEAVPDFLLSEQPFSGYVMPYGKGLKWISGSTEPVGYTPYSAKFRWEAELAVGDLIDDTHLTNQTAAFVFRDLLLGLEVMLREGVVPLSQMEKLASEIEKSYGIRTILTLRKSFKGLLVLGAMGPAETEEQIAIHTTKFTAFELSDLAIVIEAIGQAKPCLLDNVKVCVKTTDYKDTLLEVMSGMTELANYNAGSGVITFKGLAEASDHNDLASRQRFRDTTAHEIGHAVWNSLSPNQQSKWAKISWIQSDNVDEWNYASADIENHFMSSYAKNNPEEDFCEHFSFYVMHGPEFRALNKSGTKLSNKAALKAKYKFIKSLFQQDGSKAAEFELTPLMTLSEMQENAKITIAQINEEDALMLAQARERSMFEVLKRKLGSQIIDIEKLDGEEQIHDSEGRAFEEDEDEFEEWASYEYLDDADSGIAGIDQEDGYLYEDNAAKNQAFAEAQMIRKSEIKASMLAEKLYGAISQVDSLTVRIHSERAFEIALGSDLTKNRETTVAEVMAGLSELVQELGVTELHMNKPNSVALEVFFKMAKGIDPKRLEILKQHAAVSIEVDDLSSGQLENVSSVRLANGALIFNFIDPHSVDRIRHIAALKEGHGS